MIVFSSFISTMMTNSTMIIDAFHFKIILLLRFILDIDLASKITANNSELVELCPRTVQYIICREW